jgi:heme/copper-type cytochrome/quinol oxidase subunit 2
MNQRRLPSLALRVSVMNFIRRGWFAPLFALALTLAMATAASACPSCKSALGDSPEGQRLVHGYFLSICFMVAMPFTVFGGLSAYMYYLVRSARRHAAQASTTTPVDEPVSA